MPRHAAPGPPPRLGYVCRARAASSGLARPTHRAAQPRSREQRVHVPEPPKVYIKSSCLPCLSHIYPGQDGVGGLARPTHRTAQHSSVESSESHAPEPPKVYKLVSLAAPLLHICPGPRAASMASSTPWPAHLAAEPRLVLEQRIHRHEPPDAYKIRRGRRRARAAQSEARCQVHVGPDTSIRQGKRGGKGGRTGQEGENKGTVARAVFARVRRASTQPSGGERAPPRVVAVWSAVAREGGVKSRRRGLPPLSMSQRRDTEREVRDDALHRWT